MHNTGRYKPYPAYKDSGVEWLGKVPEGWNSKPLKYMCGFQNGYPFKPENWCDDGVPIIRIENLNKGERFNCSDESVGEKYHVSLGDLLFGWSGNKGTSFGPFVWQRDGLHYLNQHIFKITIPKCDKDWLYWALKAATVYIEEETHGIIGMVHVTKGKLGSIQVPDVPLPEQTAIAAFLDRETARLDALIAKKQRLLELLAEKRAAVISHAVTKGLDPDAPMKDSGVEWLGEVPAHWEVVPFKWCCTVISGQVDPKEESFLDKILIAPNHIESNTGRLFLRETVEEQGAISGKYQFPPDCVLYSKIRPELCKSVHADFEGLCSADMYAIKGSDNRLKSKFIHYMTLSDNFTRFAVLASERVAMPKVNREAIGAFYLVIPPPSEQEYIVEYLDEETSNSDALTTKIQAAITTLQEYRTALITAAVTGKIDVREEGQGTT